jgi:hypothetical protein
MQIKCKNLMSRSILFNLLKSLLMPILLMVSLFFLFCKNLESQNPTFPDPDTSFVEQRRNMAQLRADFKARVNGYISYLKSIYQHNTFTSMLSFGDPNLLVGYVPDGGGGNEFEVFIRKETKLKYNFYTTEETAFIPGSTKASTRKNGDITTENSFFFLYDALYPPDNSRNTAWHEAQHGAMRNGVNVSDDHIYIRNYAETIIEIVLPKLQKFEKKIEEAWQKSKGKKLDYYDEHEIWKDSYAIWMDIKKSFSKVAHLTDEQKEEYKNLTGIYFPDIKTLEDAYKTGKHQGIYPPKWLFSEDFFYKDVFIKILPPVLNKNNQFELSFQVLSHPYKLEIPESGLVKVKIINLFANANFDVYDNDNKTQKLATQVREWTYDLSKGNFKKGYLVVSTDEDITIEVSYEYKPKPNYDILKDFRYRPASASVKLTKSKKPCSYKYSEWSECDPKTGKQTRKLISKTPKDCIEKEKPVLEQSCTPAIKDEEKEKAERERLEKERIEHEKAEKERIEREQREAERKKAEEEKSKEAPTCSYEYSNWGECDRATKKQTRTVIAKKPEGCIEKEKPVLEQSCTPPPTEEEQRRALFNCICKYSYGIVGAHYHPEPVKGYSPSCDDTGNGPCMGGDWGCYRYFMSYNENVLKYCFGIDSKDKGDSKYKDEYLKAVSIIKEENKKFAKPLSVKIKASKNPADFGDIVELTAETIGGTGGYKWSWSGCAQDAKDASAKVVNTRTCTSCTASVTVTDQDGNTASDSLLIQCNNLKVKLTKESPKENKIPIGGKATFLAEVFSGDKPYSGPTLSYLWERNPDVLFGDPKNPQYELKGGSQMRNSAIFKKTGTIPVWVVVRREIDGIWRTVGESEQIKIEVVNPELSIKASPERPMVGQEVKLEVSTNPPMGDDLVSFWWDIPGYFSGTGNKATFKPKDTKPIKAVVHAKSKDNGEEIGTKEITITSQGYQVSISEPRYLGPKPMIWKCDTQFGGACPGLVEVGDTQFAVFRDIFMKATVTPAPDSPRYRWSIDPAGSCGFPGAGSEIKINCSNIGTYTVRVVVTNAEGIKLGEAAQTVTISISDEMLKASTKSKEAYEKLQQAKRLVNEGKLDEAINLANEAVSLDPKNSEAKALKDKWMKDKEQITQHKKQREIETQKKAKADQIWNECIELSKQNRLNEALGKCKESLNYWSDDKRRQAVANLESEIANQTQKKAQADKLWNDCIAMVKQNRLNDAVPLCEQSLNYWASDDRRRALNELQTKVQQANEEAQRKATADRLWNECVDLSKQNKLNEALARCKESLNYWSSDKRLAAVKDLENKLNQRTLPSEPPLPPVSTSEVASRRIILEDSFDMENNEKGALNYNSFSKWVVKDGTVDLIGNGFYDFVPGRGLYVDLDGSTNRAGLFETRQVFQLDPGKYILSFDLAGSQRGDTNTVTVKLGNVFTENITFASNEPMRTIKRTINVSSPTSGTLSFKNSGGDNYGLLLDNVRLERVSTFETGSYSSPPQTGKGKVIFNNGNTASVYNNPTRPTTFTINQPYVITLIQNYHWNNARGSNPGTIALRDQSGRIYGPWQATGSPGQGGVPNAYWNVYTNVTLPAGTYTVIDSEPSTWAQNSESNGAGHTRIEGYPILAETNRTEGMSSGTTISSTIQVRLKNNSNQNVHLYPEGDSPSPNNRITPGETRTINIPAPTDGFLRFCAGRNGQTIQCNKKAIDPNDQSRTYTVIFDEANPFNKVIIQTGLK